jgi:molybdenum-dependent DNA-binding transcriptional regulator ModE
VRRHGGSSALTTFGKQVLATCREIEALAAAAAADRLAWLQARLTAPGG